MVLGAELEQRLSDFDAEVQSAFESARSRTSDSRRTKLGDLNLRDDLYTKMLPVFQEILSDPYLKRHFFSGTARGQRSRRLLLVFMSELVYWEYQRSFWRELHQALELERTNKSYNWFTSQMLRGYRELDIRLIVTWQGRQFVRTIVGESGFSRQLIGKAKEFVIWYFNRHPDLDPRSLNRDKFELAVESFGVWESDDYTDLLRDMVDSVSRLLRELRRLSLGNADLNDPDVIARLEQALGFHPIRGIFGFRQEEDIRELLDRTSERMRPGAFRRMLYRRAKADPRGFSLITPEGETISVKRVKDVAICYGPYRIKGSVKGDIQVVPREAISLSVLERMLRKPQGKFHSDRTYAWIHDNQPFEVFGGTSKPSLPLGYCVSALRGYLWYGKRRLGISLSAEREGRIIDVLEARRDAWLRAHLQITADAKRLQVIIPSFACSKPEHAGQTVRLELNGHPFEQNEYVVENDGFLEFQGTRIADVDPGDSEIEVSLRTVDGRHELVTETLCRTTAVDLLFNAHNREQVRPGERHYAGKEFVLFHGTRIPISAGDGVEVTGAGSFGPFEIHRVRWVGDPSQQYAFDLRIGDVRWMFSQPFEADMRLSVHNEGHFLPQEQNAAFNTEDVTFLIELKAHSLTASELVDQLSLVVEKDREFLTSVGFRALMANETMVPESVEGVYELHVEQLLQELQESELIDSVVGAYRWTIAARPDPRADHEPIAVQDLLLLPQLSASGLDAKMTEGEESIVTVSCESAYLAGEGGRPTNVLQLACVPQARFDSKSRKLWAPWVQKIVRLVYPPTKVNLRFEPSVFGVRLICDGKIRRGRQLTYHDLVSAFLAVLAPVDELVIVSAVGREDLMATDRRGRGTFELSSLLEATTETHTVVTVSCGDVETSIQIIWQPSLVFRAEECTLDPQSDGSARLDVRFDVTGPDRAPIAFLVADSRARELARECVEAADIREGIITIPVDLAKLEGARELHCVAYADSARLDSVIVRFSGTMVRPEDEDLLNTLQEALERIPDAEATELLEIAQQLDLLEDMGIGSAVSENAHLLFSAENLEKLYRSYVRLESRALRNYFRRFKGSMLPPGEGIGIPQLKKSCAIPVPRLQLACMERLIEEGDGAGAEELIDLMAEGQVGWDKGIEVLLRNKECSSEMIRDIVQYDELHTMPDAYIGLMERLSELFHKPMTRRARAARDWKRAVQLAESESLVEVEVVNWNANGLDCGFGLITGLLPIEELDARRYGLAGGRVAIRNQLHRLVGESIWVIVRRVEPAESLLLLSETRAAVELKKRALSLLSEGDIVSGVVTNVVEFGAFVDLGGADGLIHKSELSWQAFAHPTDVVSRGDKVQVLVQSVDLDRERVELSRKRLEPDPMLEELKKYRVGQNVTCSVEECTGDGIHVDLGSGVQGFVPLGEVADPPPRTMQQMPSEGSELTARVLCVEVDDRRLLLSIKQVGKEELYLGTMRISLDG